MAYTLTIDGVSMPTPKQDGVVVKKEKIWSGSTGRSASGLMNGSITSEKHSISISWGTLTSEQASTIWNATTGTTPWHTLKYVDGLGSTSTLSVYFSTPTYTVHRATGRSKISGCTVDAVER